ncbi:serine protease, partial [filamentous cyanobacterium CCP5]
IGFAIPVDQVQPFIAAVEAGTASQSAATANPRFDRDPEPVAIGGPTIEGRLDESSAVLPDGSFFNSYVFQGQSGQRVAIEMDSDELNPYLILLSPTGREFQIQDNDSGGDANARLLAELPYSGEYIVLANAFAEGEAGQYRLRILPEGGQAAAPASPGEYILTTEGLLGSDNPTLADGSRYQEYSFQGQAGQEIRITLESPDFDTYVFIGDADRNILADNDDISAENLNSELVFTLPQTGLYYVVVNAYDHTGQGRYQLTVEEISQSTTDEG